VDEWRELTSAYALDALEEPDRTRLEAHLLECEECAAEVRSWADVTAVLAYAAPPVEVPPEVRARVVQSVSGTASQDTTAQVIQGRFSRPSTTKIPAPLGPWLLAAASLLLAVGLGVYSLQLRRLASETGTVVVVLAASDLVRVDLAGQVVAPQASARAFWSQAQGLVFTASNLPPLPSGRTYQLWIISGETPVGAGLLKPGQDGRAHAVFSPPAGISRAAAMAVTSEPDGGVPAPTGDKFLVGLVN
jgi:anti-sigma-K factor RskA